VASWGVDHAAVAHYHHEDILRRARKDHLVRLAMKERRSRWVLALEFMVAHRPRRSVRPAHADAGSNFSALRTYLVAPTER
jgi:hypothetical protein